MNTRLGSRVRQLRTVLGAAAGSRTVEKAVHSAVCEAGDQVKDIFTSKISVLERTYLSSIL